MHTSRPFGGPRMKPHLVLVIIIAISAPVFAQTDNGQASASPESQTPTTSVAEPAKNDAPPHAHTGWAALAKDTARDFMAFPKRRSSWTLLGIGGGLALATHPTDDYVETHITGNKTADNVFKL